MFFWDQDQNMTILTWRIQYQVDIISWATINEWPSWSWSYDSWIYNYLCNPPITSDVVSSNPAQEYNIEWWSLSLTASGWWFSPGPPVSSTNKTDGHDITESGVKHHKSNQPTNQPTKHFGYFSLLLVEMQYFEIMWPTLCCYSDCSNSTVASGIFGRW